MDRNLIQRFFRRARHVVVNLLLMAVSLGAAILMAEGIVRVFAPQQLILIRPDLWQPADTVGWLHRPNVDVLINTGERTVRVLTDNRGFRVGDVRTETADRQILVLGDSFMEALQVEYEQSAAALLEASLDGHLNGPVAVRNAGIGGWDPDQYLLRLRSLIRRDEYDLVIVALYMGNDVISQRRDYVPPREPVERYRFQWPSSFSSQALTHAILRPINDILEVRSHLYLFFKNRMQGVRMELGLAALTFPPQFLSSEADSRRWQVTTDICVEIAGLATRHGAQTLFVLIPASFQVDESNLHTYVEGYDLDIDAVDLRQPHEKLGEALSSHDLDFIDLLSPFRARHSEGVTLYGHVDQHFSPEGHALFADLVGDRVRGLLREGSPGGAGR